MAFSINYKKHDVELEWHLDRRHWIALLSTLFCLSLVILYLASLFLAEPDTAKIKDVKTAKTVLVEQKKQVADLKERTQIELGALKLKIGELQSQMLRVSALGAVLQEKAKLEGDEFDFEVRPATGGPVSKISLSSFSENQSIPLLDDIDKLLIELDQQEKQLGLLEAVLMNHNIQEQSYISGRPITKGWLSSYFGTRKDPFNGLPSMHKGVDFAGKDGSKIIATGAGIVTWAGERYGYGNLIEIEHGHGLRTRYGHNKKVLVALGDVVTKGQHIGVMGSTGRSTGPHVHYEVLKDGKQIDPVKYVYRKPK